MSERFVVVMAGDSLGRTRIRGPRSPKRVGREPALYSRAIEAGVLEPLESMFAIGTQRRVSTGP